MYSPQEFHFMCKLGGCEGGVSAIECEVRAAGLRSSQEETVFGGMMEHITPNTHMLHMTPKHVRIHMTATTM